MLLFIIRFQAKIQGRDEKKWVLNEETVQAFLNKKIKQNKPTNTKENRPEVWLGGLLAIKHDMPCNPPKIWYDVYQMGHWSKTVNGKIESANTRRKTVKQNSKRMVQKINTISRGRVLPAPSYTNFEDVQTAASLTQGGLLHNHMIP